MFELHNAGLSESPYQERRIEYFQENLELFPGEKNDEDTVLNFGRGKARLYGGWAEFQRVRRHMRTWLNGYRIRVGPISVGLMNTGSLETHRKTMRVGRQS